LFKILAERKEKILGTWFKMIVDTYPEETGKFLIRKKNRFDNPIGFSLNKELEAIFDELIGKQRKQVFQDSIEEIVKFRVVQEFSPSRAIGFFLFLKTATRNALKTSLNKPGIFKELLEYESMIDTLTLMAFEEFVGCTLKIREIRERQQQNGGIRLHTLKNVPERDKKSGSDIEK
jgi:RsbT co-antagonist protein rsbRD N-terminal domain